PMLPVGSSPFCAIGSRATRLSSRGGPQARSGRAPPSPRNGGGGRGGGGRGTLALFARHRGARRRGRQRREVDLVLFDPLRVRLSRRHLALDLVVVHDLAL